MIIPAAVPYGLIEMVLFFGLVIGLAVWELVRVRRSLRDDQRRHPPSSGGAHEDDPTS